MIIVAYLKDISKHLSGNHSSQRYMYITSYVLFTKSLLL